jgi:hypothetical protein
LETAGIFVLMRLGCSTLLITSKRFMLKLFLVKLQLNKLTLNTPTDDDTNLFDYVESITCFQRIHLLSNLLRFNLIIEIK